jgi:hypothetical protein
MSGNFANKRTVRPAHQLPLLVCLDVCANSSRVVPPTHPQPYIFFGEFPEVPPPDFSHQVLEGGDIFENAASKKNNNAPNLIQRRQLLHFRFIDGCTPTPPKPDSSRQIVDPPVRTMSETVFEAFKRTESCKFTSSNQKYAALP